MCICWTFLHNAAAPFSVSEFLKKHETEFFEVVNPKLSLLTLIRKGVITEDVESSIIKTSNTKDAQEILHRHLTHHANVDTLRMYCEVAIDAHGFPNMQALGSRMKEELPQRGWLELMIVSVCNSGCVTYNCFFSLCVSMWVWVWVGVLCMCV